MSSFENGVLATLGLLAIAAFCCFVGWNMGKSSITDDCKRFGEFDRLGAAYVCALKVKP